MTYNEIVFEGSEYFQVLETKKIDKNVSIFVESKQFGSNCPLCKELSNRVHNYYTRRVMDLPMLGN
jgi:hypothetical protein